MDDAKWTPGPWWPFIRLDTATFAVFGPENDPKTPVVEWTGFDRLPDKSNLEIAANAHLIAAAPEMAEALEPFAQSGFQDALGGNIEGDESPVFERQGCRLTLGHFRRAFAALAKARGEP